MKIPKKSNENQQVFEKYYSELCKGQNLSPLTNIKKKLSNKILDFVGDGVKLHEWLTLLKALRTDRTLKAIAIRSRHLRQTVREDINTEAKAHQLHGVPVMFAKFIVKRIVDACCRCIKHSEELTSVVLERIPLDKDDVSQIAQAIQQSKSLKELALPYCHITDKGCQLLCNVLRTKDALSSLDLSGCDITHVGAAYICEALKKQELMRLEECWKQSLRYNSCDPEAMTGLRRLTLNCNSLIGNAGIKLLCSILLDDHWLKALDVQACGLTESALEGVLELILHNKTLQIVDVRSNDIHHSLISSIIAMQEDKISSCKTKYKWLHEVPSNNRLVSPMSSSNKNLSSRPVHSNITVRSTNMYTVQKPKKFDDSRNVNSDTTLYAATAHNVSNQAKHIKSCDILPQRNKSNTSVTDLSSVMMSQRINSSTSVATKSTGIVPQIINNSITNMAEKFSDTLPQKNTSNTIVAKNSTLHLHLNRSTTDKNSCSSCQRFVGDNGLRVSSERLSDQKHANKRTNTGCKIKTRIAVRFGDCGAPERLAVCSPSAGDLFQKLLMAEA